MNDDVRGSAGLCWMMGKGKSTDVQGDVLCIALQIAESLTVQPIVAIAMWRVAGSARIVGEVVVCRLAYFWVGRERGIRILHGDDHGEVLGSIQLQSSN
jgi:hypothetical protein